MVFFIDDSLWDDMASASLEHIPTVMVTFVHATFEHIRNVSTVTEPILTKN